MERRTRGDAAEDRGGSAATPTRASASGWAELDGYRVVRLVRRTAASESYLAYHLVSGSYRDVIVTAPAASGDLPWLGQSLEAQAAVARTVRHPDAYAVEDVGVTRDGRLYVATERPTGRPIVELLREPAALDPERALQLVLAAVDVVAVAHGAGVVHGRLSPESILVIPQRDGALERVAVTGFGAAMADRDFADEHAQYAGPERRAGGPPTTVDDVFALGSVLGALLSGRVPPPVSPTGASGGSADDDGLAGTTDLAEVLRRARATDPGARYRTARELGTALRQISDGGGAPASFAWTDAAAERVVARTATPAGSPFADVTWATAATGLPWYRRPLVAEVGALTVVSAVALAVLLRRETPPRSPLLRESGPDVTRAMAQRPSERARSTPAASPPAAGPVTALAPMSIPMPLAEGAVTGAVPSTPVVGGNLARALGAGVMADAARERTVDLPAAGARAAPVPRVDTGARRGPAAVAAVPARRTDAPVPLAASVVGPAAVPTAAARAASPPDAGAEVATAGAPGAARGPTSSIGGEVLPAHEEAASASAAVRTVVTEYANAVETRDVARLRHVYPNMTDRQRRAWTTFFGSVTDLRTHLVADQVTVAGDTALARVSGVYEYENAQPHRAERLPVSFKVTLAREASGWRIRAVE